MKTKIILSALCICMLIFAGAVTMGPNVRADEFEIDITATINGSSEEITVSGEVEDVEHKAAVEEEVETTASVEEEASVTGVIDKTLLMERREQIAQEDAERRREHYAAQEQEPQPMRMAAILPVTGSVNLMVLLTVSFLLGLTLPNVWKLAVQKTRRNKNL